MKWKTSIQEFIYSMSTNDKYSGFDSRKSFNRINTPESERFLYHHDDESSYRLDSGMGFSGDIDANINKNTYDGVHEVRLAWRHISSWLSNNNADLKSSLQSPCTDSDILEFQKDLNVKLPNCVCEFYKLTDGQSVYNDSGCGGLIFGLKLLPLEEIAQLVETWRKVADTLNAELSHIKQSQKVMQLSKVETSHSSNNVCSKKMSGSSSTVNLFDKTPQNDSPQTISALSSPSSAKKFNNVKKSVVQTQRSIPPGRIHPQYAHHMWIPLITDDIGNCVAIDLAPPDSKNWGQVILFGRDFDTKFLLADNFGDFLLQFANDLEKGNWKLREVENRHSEVLFGGLEELIFIDKESNMELSYMEELKRRSLHKWIETLGSSGENLEPTMQEFIESIKNESKPDMKVNYLKSIDAIINTHLSMIDELNVPINHSSYKVPPIVSANKTASARGGSPLKIDTANIDDQSTRLENIVLDSDDSDNDKENAEELIDDGIDLQNVPL